MSTSPAYAPKARSGSKAAADSSYALLQRRCACGGGSAGLSGKCASCEQEERLGTSGLQAKLTVNSPGDIYEQEADRIADQVMRADNADPSAPQISPLAQHQHKPQQEEELQEKSLQRQELGEEEEEEELQAKPLQRQEAGQEEEEEELQAKSVQASSKAASSAGFARMLGAETASGAPLAPQARAFFEPRFGRQLSDVRIHTGRRAAMLSRHINARAFTHRRHVYFGAGQYDADSTEGRRLIAHELTHTLQQRPSPPNSAMQTTVKEFDGQPSLDSTADGPVPAEPPPIALQTRERREEEVLQAMPASTTDAQAAAATSAPLVCAPSSCQCDGDAETALWIAQTSAVIAMKAAQKELDGYDRASRRQRRALKRVFGRSFGFAAFTPDNRSTVSQRLSQASTFLEGLKINQDLLCDYSGRTRDCQKPDANAFYEPSGQRIVFCSSNQSVSDPIATSVSNPARLAVAEHAELEEEASLEENVVGRQRRALSKGQTGSPEAGPQSGSNAPTGQFQSASSGPGELLSETTVPTEARTPSEGDLLRHFENQRLLGRAELTRLMVHESIHHAIQPSITEIYEPQPIFKSIGGRGVSARELAPAALQNAESYARFVLDYISTFELDVRVDDVELLPSEAATLLLPIVGKDRRPLEIQVGPLVGRRKISLAVQLAQQSIFEAVKGLGMLLANRLNAWSDYPTEAEGLITLLQGVLGVADLGSPGPAAEATLSDIEIALESVAGQMSQKKISVRRRHRGEHDPEEEIRLTVQGGLKFNQLSRLDQVRELLSQLLALESQVASLSDVLTEFSCRFGILQGFGRCPAAQGTQPNSSGQSGSTSVQAKPLQGSPSVMPSAFSARLGSQAAGGFPLSPPDRTLFESRFGRDFSQVRLHADRQAEALCSDLSARALTHSSHIYFGPGQYKPSSTEGRRLMAHELTHTVQQGADQQAPSLQRRNIFQEFAGLFRSDEIPDDELSRYLGHLTGNRTIEDFTDSDNKARAVVNRLQKEQDLFGFELTVELRQLLIQEMQSGFTGDDDEEAILHLMTSAEVRTVQSLFEGDHALDAESLLSDFHGPQRRRLQNLYAAIGVEVEDLERRENFQGCNGPEEEAVQEGMNASRADLRHALTFMEEHPDSPSIPIAFWLAFRISEPDEDQKRDMLEKLRSIREGIPRVHYICDHGEATGSSCNDGALGHASLGPGGEGISVCFAPAGQQQENDFFFKERPQKARLITHEAAHFFLAVDDTGGYFGTECGETLINTSCLRGTREDCGTSGRPSAERLDTADAYACFVHFLGLAAEEESGARSDESEEPTLEERFRESRGESLVIKSYLPEAIFSEPLFGDAIYVNAPQGTEQFALDGVPLASGFSYQWTLQAGGQTFELQADEYLDKPGAIVPEDVKARLRELVVPRSGESREGEQAAAPAVEAEVVCRVRLFTDAPESDQVEKRLQVDLEAEQPELGL